MLILSGSSLLLSACSSDSSAGEPRPATTATELGPSQITAETVPAPELPPPCEIANLALWTARVIVGADSADAVIRMRNDGDVWCEANVSQSPNVDPLMEPDVWLDPGAWADLIVGQSGDECLSPAPVTLVELDINGVKVVVPTAMVATCGWQLTALYPNEISTGPCDPAALQFVGTDSFLVVRNTALSTCAVGELSAVSDFGPLQPIEPHADIAIAELAADDTIAFRYELNPVLDCQVASTRAAVTFTLIGTFETEAPNCSLYEFGAGRPFYGDPDGPLWNLPPGPFDVQSALAQLDPFAPSVD